MRKLSIGKIIALLLNIISIISFLLVVIYFFAIYNSKYFGSSYTRIKEKFGFEFTDNIYTVEAFEEKPQLPINGKIKFLYKPVLSVAQTHDAVENAKAKIYTYDLKELNIVPQVIETRINRVKVPATDHFNVKEGARLISLKFADIRNEQNELLQYQFACLEKDAYEDFGNPNTLNIQLPLGNQVLHIRAVDFKNKTATKYHRFTVFSKVPLAKLPWFWFLVIFAFLYPTLYFSIRYWLNKKQAKLEQQLALEQQRNKMTADLHDDIGATLSSLQMNSAVASLLLQKDPTEAKTILEKIEQQSQSLADRIGDLIWSQKPGKEEFISVSLRIKNFANDILGATNINYQIEIDPKIDTVITDISTRKNIVMLIKEAINNAAKYSKAAELSLKMQLENNNLTLSITDNGIGFDSTKTIGNGLANMRKRTEDLGGKFTINSQIGAGTEIVAYIPISLDLRIKRH
jgi:signal transduction histidine kinase